MHVDELLTDRLSLRFRGPALTPRLCPDPPLNTIRLFCLLFPDSLLFEHLKHLMFMDKFVESLPDNGTMFSGYSRFTACGSV